MVTVTRAEFLADAAGVLRRTETEGPIGVTGEAGEVRMVVHAPRDARPLPEEMAGEIVELRARVKELEDHILVRACDDAVARSFGRNTYAWDVATEIRSRRGEEWEGTDVAGLDRI